MSRREPVIVAGRDGLRGLIETELPPRPGAESTVVVRLESGLRVAIPVELMTVQEDGTYTVPLGPADVGRLRIEGPGAMTVIPVAAEEIEVLKRTVETGRVRITKTVHERDEVVDVPLLREEVQVERVAVNRVIEGPVEVRHEGDTMIVPILEEVLVVEKRLMLKEELRVTRRRVEDHRPQRVTLRSEEAMVERLAPGDRTEGQG